MAQVEEGSRRRLDVSIEWPPELLEIKQQVLDVYYRINEFEKQVDASVSHHREEQEAMQASLHAVRDVRQVTGEDGEFLQILYSGDPVNLAGLMTIALGLKDEPLVAAFELMKPEDVEQIRVILMSD